LCVCVCMRVCDILRVYTLSHSTSHFFFNGLF
jgi:hypothetical protein